MAGESQETPGTPADPTVITTENITRAVRAERDYTNGQLEVLRVRLNGMDEATKVLHETVTRTPTDIQVAIGHARELDNEKFRSVEKQFLGRDEAVKAAFAAQEKQALAEQASNTKAINKSEQSTTETIKTNQELGKATTDALTKSLDEVKLSVASILAGRQGGKDQLAAVYALAGFLVSLVILGGILAATGAFTRG